MKTSPIKVSLSPFKRTSVIPGNLNLLSTNQCMLRISFEIKHDHFFESTLFLFYKNNFIRTRASYLTKS